MPRIEIVPSILSADAGRLAEQVKEAESAGADRIQVDVMGGHFVPNLTFGPGVVEAVRRATSLPIEAHLMVERPELFLEAFARSGATLIEVQVEATSSLYRTVQAIKELGAKAGVAINPATPLEDLREILPYVDLVNVMAVEPGFGGQKFIPSSTDKIQRLRALSPKGEIEVDGADEVDPALNLIKGRGGALVREKLVAAASRRFVVVVDESKLVKQLGVGVLPVEVLPFLWRSTAERLAALAQSLVVRGGEETPYISDNGNLILDVTMEGGIKNPADFGVELKKLTGVVEHGLFIGMADTVIVAGPEGPKAIGRLSGGAVARSNPPPKA